MASFVVDKGLDVLEAQINEAAPNRSKASDGSIGDKAHAERKSDHNPEHPPPPGNPDNEVDARDFTHDPKHGADMAEITEAIRLSKDRRVSYVIFNDRIFSSYATSTRKAWEWGPYNPDDPNHDRHTNHAHVSVNDVHHDETQKWSISMSISDDDAAKIARAVWSFDVDPTAGTYSASGALFVALGRTGALANNLVPALSTAVQNALNGDHPDEASLIAAIEKALGDALGSALPAALDATMKAAVKSALKEGTD